MLQVRLGTCRTPVFAFDGKKYYTTCVCIANSLCNYFVYRETTGFSRRKKAPNRRGWCACLEGQFGWRWRPVGLPFDFVSVDLADQRPDVECAVAAREASDARGQEQDGKGGEEQLRMHQCGRAGAGPGVFWLDLDYGHLDLLDLDDGGA